GSRRRHRKGPRGSGKRYSGSRKAGRKAGRKVRLLTAHRAVAREVADETLVAGEGEGRLGKFVARSRKACRGGAAGADEAAPFSPEPVGAPDCQADVGDVTEIGGELGQVG